MHVDDARRQRDRVSGAAETKVITNQVFRWNAFPARTESYGKSLYAADGVRDASFQQVLILNSVVSSQWLTQSVCIPQHIIVAAGCRKVAAVHVHNRLTQVLEALPLHDHTP